MIHLYGRPSANPRPNPNPTPGQQRGHELLVWRHSDAVEYASLSCLPMSPDRRSAVVHVYGDLRLTPTLTLTLRNRGNGEIECFQSGNTGAR